MANIPFGYLCEVDRVEKLEDGIHHRIWIQTLCPKKYTLVFELWKVGPDFKPGFRFWLDFEDGTKKRLCLRRLEGSSDILRKVEE